MEPGTLIGRAVRRERERAGLSLSSLARSAGLAKSTLSQLEAGHGNPNIETLWAIATALGVPFSFLFETPSPSRRLVRAGEGEAIEADAARFTAVLLADCPPTARRDLYRSALRAGEPRRAEAHPAGTIEHAVVCQGRVRLGPNDATEELGAGDYYAYAADEPHLYEALTETALLLLVMESVR